LVGDFCCDITANYASWQARRLWTIGYKLEERLKAKGRIAARQKRPNSQSTEANEVNKAASVTCHVSRVTCHFLPIFVPFVSFGGKMACQSAFISGQNPAENLASLAPWRLIRIH
jgi:hypothetical protein